MKISTQAKLISTALAALAIAAPIAHGQTGGTVLPGSYPQLKAGEGFSFKAPSYWNSTLAPNTPRVSVNRSLGVPAQFLGAGIQTVPRTPRAGEGFSFEAPSYWNAAPSYWSTAQGTDASIAPRSINRSLGVPAQYLGTGTQATSQQVSAASGGFDWLDAGVGAAFVAGVGMLGLGGFVAVRRRHRLAQV
jgi:hypothetical protein